MGNVRTESQSDMQEEAVSGVLRHLEERHHRRSDIADDAVLYAPTDGEVVDVRFASFLAKLFQMLAGDVEGECLELPFD